MCPNCKERIWKVFSTNLLCLDIACCNGQFTVIYRLHDNPHPSKAYIPLCWGRRTFFVAVQLRAEDDVQCYYALRLFCVSCVLHTLCAINHQFAFSPIRYREFSCWELVCVLGPWTYYFLRINLLQNDAVIVLLRGGFVAQFGQKITP